MERQLHGVLAGHLWVSTQPLCASDSSRVKGRMWASALSGVTMSIRARVVSRPGSGQRPILQPLLITAQARALPFAGFPLLSLPLGTSRHPVFFSISAKPRRCMLLKCSQGVGWRAGLVLSALWDAAPRPCPGSGGQGWRGAGGRRRHLRRGSLRVWSPAGRTRVLRAAALLWAPAGPPLLPSACQLGPNLISVLSVRTPLKLNSAYYQQLPCHRRTLPPKAALAR